jgi:enterochelin esterase family protein
MIGFVFALMTAQSQNPDAFLEALAKLRMKQPVTSDLAKKLLQDQKEATVRIRGLDAIWIVPVGSASQVRVTSDDKTVNLALVKCLDGDYWVGTTGLYDGAAFNWTVSVNGQLHDRSKTLEAYLKHPDTFAKASVPRGILLAMPKHTSRVYPGVTRNWWIYVPSQYKPESPACLMVWQDGQWAKNYVPTSFDNLIHAGDMPVTIGVFIEPGTKPDGSSNRSFEYDRLGDAYSRLLHEEILTEVEKQYKLRREPEARAIAGSSSGAICAFTAAWERPDKFRKVLSWIGSYVDLAKLHGDTMGGDDYPSLIRKTEPKPLRIWLQDGENDIENQFGSWWHSNLQMERALNFMGYDLMWQPGKGFHSNQHGEATLPTALRWLWRDVR